jgi:hypothetical protein
MRRLSWIVAALLGTALAACAPRLDAEADRTARDFFRAVQAKDWRAVDGALSSRFLATPDYRQAIVAAADAAPDTQPRQVKAVGWSPGRLDQGEAVAVLHLYRYAAADLVVRTAVRRQGDRSTVEGLAVTRLAPGTLQANAFTFTGKTARHLGFLASALLSPLVMLAAAVLAATSRDLRLKPLWVALALVGVGRAWFNWTTGQGGFSPAEIGLISAGFGRESEITPWILKFSAPVGALITLAWLGLRPRRTAA